MRQGTNQDVVIPLEKYLVSGATPILLTNMVRTIVNDSQALAAGSTITHMDVTVAAGKRMQIENLTIGAYANAGGVATKQVSMNLRVTFSGGADYSFCSDLEMVQAASWAFVLQTGRTLVFSAGDRIRAQTTNQVGNGAGTGYVLGSYITFDA